MRNVLSFEAFKDLAKKKEFKEELIGRSDIIDIDNGTMTIYSEHINKYLEQYGCKDINDLEDTLWYSYGVFARIID